MIHVNVPLVVRSMANMVMKFINKKNVYYVTYEQMVDMMGEDKMNAIKLGEHFDGEFTWLKFCPEDQMSVEELCKKHNLSDKEASKYKQCLEKLIKTYTR